MKVYIAGTRASFEVGVEERDRPLVRGLPRDETLPVGCTADGSAEAQEYATAYNRAIVRHLRRAESS